MKAYERFISKKEIELVHEQSLKILEKIGVKFEHEFALEVFKNHGVRVEGDMVYLDEKTIQSILDLCPEKFTLHSSKGNIDIGGGTFVKLPVGCPAYIKSDEGIKKIKNSEIIKLFKLIDTSDSIDCNQVNFFLEDKGFTPEIKQYSYLALLHKYSNKPSPFAIPDTSCVKKNIRQEFAKGIQLTKRFEGIQNKLVSSVGFNPISPLCYDRDPIERLLGACDENQSIWLASCAMPVLTAPYSVASMMAMTNAEILAGIALIQLINPGTPIIYGNVSGSTDLRTIQLCIGNPEAALIAYATAGLADYYGIPFRTGGSFSDAKEVDFQAGMESMMMTQATTEIKPDMILHALGSIGTFNVVSFEKFLLDEEIYKFTERLNRGIDVSEEKFCFDILEKVGPRGTFLKGRTPKMYREEFVLPKYLNKADPNDWQSRGSEPLTDVVKKEVEERIRSYQSPKITPEQEALLNPYLPEAYRLGI